MALDGKRQGHGDGGQPHAEQHPDHQDHGDARQTGFEAHAEDERDAQNDQDLHAGNGHHEEIPAQDHGGPVNGRGHHAFQESVLLVEQQVDAAGQPVVENRHHDHPARQETHIVRGVEDLDVGRALKEAAEEDEPEQHGLDQGEQHAELLPAEPAHPPHRQGEHFLFVVLEGHDSAPGYSSTASGVPPRNPCPVWATNTSSSRGR